jgi:hypothetical protein
LDWNVPDYSTLSGRQKTLIVAITARPRRGGWHLLVDSTGMQMLGDGEWKVRKPGADYRRQWRKVHLDVDAQMLEMRAIEVTANAIGDAQTAEDELLHSVNGDGAHDTKACHEAIAYGYATTIIPTRRNDKPWAKSPAGAQA